MMKKRLLTILGALFMVMCISSCGNNASKQSAAGEDAEATESVAGAEEGTETSRAAIAEAREVFNGFMELVEKSKDGKMSDEEKFKVLETVLTKDGEWDKKYKQLKESDYTPAQWKELQEMKAKVKELMSVTVR